MPTLSEQHDRKEYTLETKYDQICCAVNSSLV